MSDKIISVQEMLNEEQQWIDNEIEKLRYRRGEIKQIWYKYYALRE